jgi:hypothetical protein
MFKGTYQLTEGQREPPQLNWAGEPVREGEGYGGRPENIPETLAEAAAKEAGRASMGWILRAP